MREEEEEEELQGPLAVGPEMGGGRDGGGVSSISWCPGATGCICRG